ncbi:hypothetical protein EGT36_19995 [Agrobacterium sp. FDAARGOS_525]|uniref:hypothetical protein n=1 Tax=Agrobacterium sp. FDAARGOS_525 TaxID=2420311 RepID=UPI000F67130A|nr:hypothetical protein [Agrobacterium sp. FDAARGOS_525]RSC30990.1 hypothetical protein EGT36_19995 [Agrobacterium sp. FDAARGOS_525]
MPKIVTTLHELRGSGRMCGEGWETLLIGLGKTKPDNEPLDYLTGLSICGLYDTLWQLPTKAEHSTACRRLALSFARPVATLADDPCAAEILDRLDDYLRGEGSSLAVQEAVPPYLRPYTWYEISSGDTWNGYEPGEAATLAAVMTTLPDGCITPYVVAHLVEEIEACLSISPDDARRIAQARHTELLSDFLSSPD